MNIKTNLINIYMGGINFSPNGEISALLLQIANFILPISIIATSVFLGLAWLRWVSKDDDEKAALPFEKVASKYIKGLVFLGISLIVLKMFTISV